MRLRNYSCTKNPYPPRGRSSKIPRDRAGGGGGVLKVKILEVKSEAKLEFPGGRRGWKQKIFCGGVIGHFLELHNMVIFCVNALIMLMHQTGVWAVGTKNLNDKNKQFKT